MPACYGGAEKRRDISPRWLRLPCLYASLTPCAARLGRLAFSVSGKLHSSTSLSLRLILLDRRDCIYRLSFASSMKCA